MTEKTPSEFISKLPYHQLLEFESELDNCVQERIIPLLRDSSSNKIDWHHFITLKGRGGDSPVELCAQVFHWMYGDKPQRIIKKIKIYKDEVERLFYMALEEYENKVDPNPVLFN